jgi:hypothetical protein
MGKVFKTIGSLIAPKMPKPPETPVLPDPESVSAKLAARDKIESRKKDGRAGTIYTSSSGAYSNSNLGGTA